MLMAAGALDRLVASLVRHCEANTLAPRCIKDVIEERLFERRRDLFSDLSLVFMDTTSCRSTAPAARPWGPIAIRRTIAPT
jgi:hypothetical protein